MYSVEHLGGVDHDRVADNGCGYHDELVVE